jgi:hypothetical protein
MISTVVIRTSPKSAEFPLKFASHSLSIILESKFAEKYDQDVRICYTEGGKTNVKLNEVTSYNLFY